MYYAILARKNYEEHVLNPIVYEGEKDPNVNFKELFKSIALMYSTTPEKMVKFWSNVDMQFTIMRLPKLPDEDKYRFDRTAGIITERKN